MMVDKLRLRARTGGPSQNLLSQQKACLRCKRCSLLSSNALYLKILYSGAAHIKQKFAIFVRQNNFELKYAGRFNFRFSGLTSGQKKGALQYFETKNIRNGLCDAWRKTFP